MTMQVCLLADDGLVLASDTLKVALTGEDFDTHESKFAFSDDGLSMCSWSGDDTAKQVGLALLARPIPQQGDLTLFLEEECSVIWKSIPLAQRQRSRLPSRLLFGLADLRRDRQLWWVAPGDRSQSQAVLGNWEANGDRYSAAAYFLQRFYKANDSRPASRDLLLLGAQVVFAAGRINPRYVQGLELALTHEGRWQRIGARETKEFLAKLQKLDSDCELMFHRS